MSEPKYRVAEAADADAIRKIVRICFNSTESRAAFSVERAGLDEIRVLERDAEIRAVTYLIPMGIFFGGRSVSNLGIAAVGVPPEHRGGGLSKQIMLAVLHEGHERGFGVSTLHPATQTLYRKVGYQTFAGYYESRVPLATIEVSDHAATLRAYRTDDREAVRALHSRWAKSFDGHLDRSEYVWQGIHRWGEVPTEGYVVLEKDELTGYCFIVREQQETLRYDLRATDILASTSGAARRLLTFASDHRSLGQDLVWNGTPSDPLLMYLGEHRCRLSLRHFVMLRILDAKRAFEARGYPRLVRAALQLEIDDPLLPANSGRWVLDVADGYGELVRGGQGALRTDAMGLAALFGQMHPASRLAAMGWIEGDAEAIETAKSIFAAPQACLTEMF